MTILFYYLELHLFSFLEFYSVNLIRLGNETCELSKVYLAGITDHFNGIKDIKSNMLEKTHLNWIRTLSLKMEQNVMELVKVRYNFSIYL